MSDDFPRLCCLMPQAIALWFHWTIHHRQARLVKPYIYLYTIQNNFSPQRHVQRQLVNLLHHLQRQTHFLLSGFHPKGQNLRQRYHSNLRRQVIHRHYLWIHDKEKFVCQKRNRSSIRLEWSDNLRQASLCWKQQLHQLSITRLLRCSLELILTLQIEESRTRWYLRGR